MFMSPPLTADIFDKTSLKKKLINGFEKEEVISSGQKTGNKLMVGCKGSGK